MSHHLDTPLAAQTGQLFLDDLYVFPGEGSTVLIMDVNSNVNGLHSEPGFHPEARYEFKVHFDGAAYEDLTWRVSFGEADSGGRQTLRVHALDGEAARDDAAARRTGAGGTDRRDGQRERHPGVGRADRRLVLHRPVAAGPHQRRGGRGHGAGPVRVAAPGREKQLRRQPRRLDRAGGLAHPSAAAARRPHRGVGRHQAGHRRRRLAADQPGRAPDDVADLLAERHRLHQPGQHPPPLRRRQRGGQVHRRADRRRGRGRRHRR